MPIRSCVVVNADTGGPTPVDIRIACGPGGDSLITAVAPRLATGSADVVVDADRCAVMPGFVDHHAHLFATAAADSSTPCGPPAVRDRADLAAALARAPSDPAGWVRGTGYIETVAGDLDADVLDGLHADRPVRIQHRSGALWTVNAAAIRALRLDTADHPGVERDPLGRPTGRLWRADDLVRSRLPGAGPPALDAVGARLAGLGIVEITDATPDLDDRSLTALITAADERRLPQRLHLLGVPLGKQVASSRVTTGPYKIVVADAPMPSLTELTAAVTAAHEAGRAVAVHCVSRAALALSLAAGVGRGDRVEHAGVVDASTARHLGELGVTVVTQPGFLADRGDDFLDGSDPGDHDDLYRCASLTRVGVPVALSSDTPYGPVDPLAVIDAAVHRRTRLGRRVGRPDERCTAAQAFAAYQSGAATPGGPERRIAVAECGDVVVLDRPGREVLADPGAARVVHTLIEGRPV
ncbi:amidohydrolase family protein [uncultured Williamsia sp.]|uniref:amidohydrolase family protein n=1 Tax=uncultured Williamsia sp. TaxID=259311 RepID=UPI00261DE685|nr:amidohydrolase family protein [uncultured Williamsia sp.]